MFNVYPRSIHGYPGGEWTKGGEDKVQEAKLAAACHSPAGHWQKTRERRRGEPWGDVPDGEHASLRNQMVFGGQNGESWTTASVAPGRIVEGWFHIL